jgi:putative DNA primase/helicase
MNFLDFAAEHGLIIDNVVEGRWARVKTTDKPKHRNGSYKFMGDVAFLQNHATMDRVAVWHPDGKVERIDRAAMLKRMAQASQQERERQEDAREFAEGMVKRAVLDVHPYLAAKGFPEEKGLVLDGELLIPMREFKLYRQINSIQRISADGTKLFLPGGKAKGSVFFIGPMMARERWLVEGYATGLSVRAALRELHREAQVVVCFSASNLSHVGMTVKGLRPVAYVMADNDESGAGAKAAEETGLPWVMPPEVKTDANDYQQSHGMRALAKLIRGRETAIA